MDWREGDSEEKEGEAEDGGCHVGLEYLLEGGQGGGVACQGEGDGEGERG